MQYIIGFFICETVDIVLRVCIQTWLARHLNIRESGGEDWNYSSSNVCKTLVKGTIGQNGGCSECCTLYIQTPSWSSSGCATILKCSTKITGMETLDARLVYSEKTALIQTTSNRFQAPLAMKKKKKKKLEHHTNQVHWLVWLEGELHHRCQTAVQLRADGPEWSGSSGSGVNGKRNTAEYEIFVPYIELCRWEVPENTIIRGRTDELSEMLQQSEYLVSLLQFRVDITEWSGNCVTWKAIVPSGDR